MSVQFKNQVLNHCREYALEFKNGILIILTEIKEAISVRFRFENLRKIQCYRNYSTGFSLEIWQITVCIGHSICEKLGSNLYVPGVTWMEEDENSN